jgi:hypothetical protein
MEEMDHNGFKSCQLHYHVDGISACKCIAQMVSRKSVQSRVLSQPFLTTSTMQPFTANQPS